MRKVDRNAIACGKTHLQEDASHTRRRCRLHIASLDHSRPRIPSYGSLKTPARCTVTLQKKGAQVTELQERQAGEIGGKPKRRAPPIPAADRRDGQNFRFTNHD